VEPVAGSDKLAGQYLDGRKRVRIEKAKSAKEAVGLAVKLANKKNEKQT